MTARAPRDVELTHSQKQIWVGQQLHAGSPLYNMAFAFEWEGELRVDCFQEAWRQVVAASDVLRTRIFDDSRQGARAVVEADGPDTIVRDLSTQGDPSDAFHRWCLARCARPFPREGALVESVLARLEPGRTGWYLNLHHVVADAWGTQRVYREVAQAYEALVGESGEGQTVPSPLYYPTAAAVQARGEGLRPSEREAGRRHWEDRRSRPGRSMALYGRPAEPEGTASRRWTLALGEERSEAFDALTRQEGFTSLSPDLSRFTLLATLLLAWAHRASGAVELGFDAPVAGRPTTESKRALGLFIEMFPFAGRVEVGESFRALGARCLDEARRFLRHATPGASAPSGATSSNVVLNYFPTPFGPFAGLPVRATWVHPGHGDRVHALRVQAHRFSGGGLVLHLDFNQSVFPEQLQRRGVAHFERMLDALLADPDRPIGTVDLLLEEERQALAAFDATQAPRAERTVVERFVERAEGDAERIALRQGNRTLTFGELAERSRAVAALLVEQGVGRGDRIAVIARRSIETVAAFLGVLRAGAAFVPVDPASPEARGHALLRDSGARIALTDDPPAWSPPADVRAIPIAEASKAGASSSLDPVGPDRDDLAYLLYTSGSTGRPKGVLIGHGGLADYLAWADRRYVRGERFVFPLFTALSFDLTLTSLFLPLVTGGTLVVYPETEGPADTAWMDVAREDAVDFVKLTPSHLMLLDRAGLGSSKIRRMVVGGENLRASLAGAVAAGRGEDFELHNEYGPTEAVVGCVAHLYDPARDTGPNVPIGGPADGVRAEVLDAMGNPVPEGVPGELWITRGGLAWGYDGAAGLTADRFRPDPRPSRGGAGGRRYRTGDLVRVSRPGRLEYLGRIDRQLKVGGVRIEPAEIETALLDLPGVESCAVVARRTPPPEPAAEPASRTCVRCGLASSYPRSSFDADGVCSICRSYEVIREHAQAYFGSLDDLREIFEESARRHRPRYDCMMLLSGGKDSTYALCRLVDMGLSVYAFTLDNGFIAEGAKENIRRVAGHLGVPVEFGSTPAMNAIFRDSLARFSNVCNGCFKAIYTLSANRAKELGIPIIVTGLSRGQMFETRLTEEMFRDGRFSVQEIDAAVLAARKAYHRADDEVSRSLDVSLFRDDRIFEELRWVDFYRYCDVELDELISYLRREVPWARPEDTGRSTNCLINDTGIFVHKQERGFHNYALPYSWDVRLGHKSSEAAQDELNDAIDPAAVRDILDEVGYVPRPSAAADGGAVLEAFYVAGDDLDEETLRSRLAERLPAALVPGRLRRLDAIPLTASGKVDEVALAKERGDEVRSAPYRPPEGPVEEYLVEVWRDELWVERVGADDDFFRLGGTSLAAIQVMLRLGEEFALDLPLDTMFSHPTLASLARLAEERILADDEALLAEGDAPDLR